ncbi:MAG: sigma-70 family RNA polymerase sigma factor [Cyanophyceae cyanobacterium]
MLPRQGIVEIFSTFVQFDCDRFSRWATDVRLRQSMTRLSQGASEKTTENFWTLYWYKLWQTQPTPLVKGHLSAYLQEVCYWAAQKTAADFASTQYSLSDRFQAAIASTDKILKGFDPNQGFRLKNYASMVFHNQVRVFLRQRQEVDICSDWGLLRKISQKRLAEALTQAGLSAARSHYILAWNCLKTLYVPSPANTTRKLPKPDKKNWQAIAALYNRERYSQLQPPGPEGSSEQIEQWLLTCARAARAYLYPTVTSINAPKPGQTGEVGDDLVREGHDSLLTNLIIEEEVQQRTTQQAQVHQVLTAALAELAPDNQQLLELYYSEQLPQKEIAQRLKTKQYTVSRRLTRIRESLLQTLAQWSQEALHVSLTSDVLKSISAVLDEWLVGYYRRHELPT